MNESEFYRLVLCAQQIPVTIVIAKSGFSMQI